jgi:hypothetical protein
MSAQAEINEQMLIRLQALEVLIQEQRREIDALNVSVKQLKDYHYNYEGLIID